jgi:hypothetical protein
VSKELDPTKLRQRAEEVAALFEPDLSTAGIRQGYSHYHKPCPYDFIDVYRVLELFGVTDPCLQHAIKKLLVAGGRGQKDIRKDVAEAIVTLTRWQQMREEERPQNQ